EDQIGQGGKQQHGHDLVEKLRIFHHQHGTGPDTVDQHGSDQHGGGGRTGQGQGQSGDHGGRNHGIVAGFGGDQAFLATLAELFGRLAGALGGRIGGPGANILAHAGNDADKGADNARADNGLPI